MKPLFISKEDSDFYDHCVSLEESMLRLSGLVPWKNLWIYNTPITHEGEQNYIHTLKAGTKGESMLLIHGYGGSGVTFFRMIEELSQEFTVYCIDLLGMGLSSRPNFTAQNTEETNDFFVESIEEWRKYIGLKRFHIVGHSLGGYVSTCYTLKYPQYISSLILLSPGGITARSKTENQKYEEMTFKHLSIKTKIYYKFIDYSARKKTTPHALIRKTRFVGRFFFRKLINSKAQNFLGTESFEHFKNYFMEIVKLPAGSEDAVHHLFDLPLAQGKAPLEDKLFEVEKEILFIFGENDAMDSLGARRLHKKDPKKFRLKVAKGSSHQLTIDNPKDTNKFILDFLSKIQSRGSSSSMEIEGI